MLVLVPRYYTIKDLLYNDLNKIAVGVRKLGQIR